MYGLAILSLMKIPCQRSGWFRNKNYDVNNNFCSISLYYLLCNDILLSQVYKQYPCSSLLLFVVSYESRYDQHNYIWY